MKAKCHSLTPCIIMLFLGAGEFNDPRTDIGREAGKAFVRRCFRLAAKHHVRCATPRDGEVYLYFDSKKSISRISDLLAEYDGRKFQRRCLNNWWR